MTTLAPQPDPHPQADPDHAHGAGGRLVYDQRCWFCRDITAQPPPTATAKEGGR